MENYTEKCFIDIAVSAISSDNVVQKTVITAIGSALEFDPDSYKYIANFVGDVFALPAQQNSSAVFDYKTVAENFCLDWPRLEITPIGAAWPKLCYIFQGRYQGNEFVCVPIFYNENGVWDGKHQSGTIFTQGGSYLYLTLGYLTSEYSENPELTIFISNTSTLTSSPEPACSISEYEIPFSITEWQPPSKLYVSTQYVEGAGSKYGINPVPAKVAYGDSVIRDTRVYNFSGEGIDNGEVVYNILYGLYIAETHTKNSYTLSTSKTIDDVSLSAEFRLTIGEEGGSEDDTMGPYDPGGTSSGGGGGGSFFQPDPTPTEIPEGSSELDSSNAGIFTRYLVSPAKLKAFGNWLWTSDIIEALLKEIINIVYGKSSDAIISLMSYPFSMAEIGLSITSSNLFLGEADSGIPATKLTKEFAHIDWGSIQLDSYWNNFLDYAPHTTIQLYLPWLGFVPIDPHECLPGTLSVKTNIELGRGTVTHNVIGNGGVCIGQFNTVCGRQLPITALDTGGKLLSAVVSAVSTAVSAGAAGAAKAAGDSAVASTYTDLLSRYPAGKWTGFADELSAARAAASAPYMRASKSAGKVAAASAVASLRPPSIVQRSGSSTGNSAGLGCQYPYVIVGRPRQSVPKNYGHHYGYPSNIYQQLSSLKGYTEVGSIHLEGIPAQLNELEEIENLLKGGVIL